MAKPQSRPAGAGDSAQVSETRDEASELVGALLADVAASSTASPSAWPTLAAAVAGSADDAITLSVPRNPTDGNLQVKIILLIYGSVERQSKLSFAGAVWYAARARTDGPALPKSRAS